MVLLASVGWGVASSGSAQNQLKRDLGSFTLYSLCVYRGPTALSASPVGVGGRGEDRVRRGGRQVTDPLKGNRKTLAGLSRLLRNKRPQGCSAGKMDPLPAVYLGSFCSPQSTGWEVKRGYPDLPTSVTNWAPASFCNKLGTCLRLAKGPGGAPRLEGLSSSKG